MRIKRKRIAGVVIAAILTSGMAVSTPVYAGTTQADMAADDAGRFERVFSTVTLNNNDVAFAVLNTVAEKDTAIPADSNGRFTYHVKNVFPLEYRIYFNKFRAGTSGDIHAFAGGNLVYKITPSGGGTTDVAKWPFPAMENFVDRYDLEDIVRNNTKDLYYDGLGFYCSDSGNTPEVLSDAEKGILTWKQGIKMYGQGNRRPYYNYGDDASGTYQTSNLQINNIVGKPGDKLEVKVYQSYIPGQEGSTVILKPIPFSTLISDVANESNGAVVESGYIYIPYEVTYDMNGATGTIPTVTDGELFTCEHNEVKVPGQGDMVRADGAELLGWSTTKIDGTVTNTSGIEGFTEPGGTYTIPETKKEDVKLYAVWGKTAPEGATLNLETRGHKQGKVGSILDRQAFANGETPTYVNGSKFTLKKLDASGNIDNSFTPIESDTTGIDGKTKISGIGEGTYQLKQSGYAEDWTNYAPSAWKVTVTKNGDDYSIDVTQEDGATEWQMKKDSAGNYTGNVFPIFDEWYWTKTARTKGTGSDPGTWEGFWEADANTLLIYNLGDGIVASGLNGQGGIPIWEWLLPGGIAGGIIVGIVVRYRMKRRHQ